MTPLHVERNVRLHAGLVIALAALPVPDLPVRGVDVLGQGVSPPRREVALITCEICLTLVYSHDMLFAVLDRLFEMQKSHTYHI